MMVYLYLVLGLWLAWCLGHLVLMLLARPNYPSFNGFRIVIPDSAMNILTREELVALILHEQGHRYHWHVWKNYLLVCLFMRASTKRRLAQELEADDYAAAHGHALELATALRKLSCAAADSDRAHRLVLLHMQQWHESKNQGV